ncbi:MAG: Bifunctional protein GlmU [Candidatus Woesearchaeota archaeon]|nr:Bifunctional protein GlmU [Candidatus Woesearchaeota archaeon]
MRERVTLTIDENLLKNIDHSIDGHNVKNRSHAIEMLLNKALGSKMPSKALILAGGKSKPLKSKFKDTPHALTPFNGSTVIEEIIKLFKKYGVKDIIITLHHDADVIQNHLESKDLGVRLIFIKEKFPMGTAGALRNAKEYLKSTFFMTNADELKNINLKDMYMFHLDHHGKTTIALTTVEDPSKYGVANLTGYNIISFMEKPKKQNAPSNLINAGLYVMDPEAIEFIPDGFATLENDVFPKLAKENKLIGYSFGGQWFSLNSEKEYSIAEKKWKDI